VAADQSNLRHGETILKEPGYSFMPKVMEAKVFDSCSLNEAIPSLSDCSGC
jgi:hypothetical protein